jgi:hypothetical protein
MTPAEKTFRDAAAKADAWADKAESAGRLEDAATLATLAAAAKDKADRIAAAEIERPPALRGAADPDPSTACALCGAHGVRLPGHGLLACSNRSCIRHGLPVSPDWF